MAKTIKKKIVSKTLEAEMDSTEAKEVGESVGEMIRAWPNDRRRDRMIFAAVCMLNACNNPTVTGKKRRRT